MSLPTDPDPGRGPTGGAESRPNRRRWWIAGGVGAVVVAALLAFGVFGVHTLFIEDTVNEEGPVFESGSELTTSIAEGGDAAVPAPPSVVETETETEGAGATTAPAEPVVTVAGTGTFIGVDHPGQGTANLLTDGTQTFVRFEDDFSTDNGPDLFAVVYVDGSLIELGVLKGNIGAQNYELPADVDPASVDTVAVWCKRFDSTFTEAAIG